MGQVRIKKGSMYLVLGGWGLVGWFRRYTEPFGLTSTELYFEFSPLSYLERGKTFFSFSQKDAYQLDVSLRVH